MKSRITLALLLLFVMAPLDHAQAIEIILFDFTKAESLKHWTNLELPKAKEPAVKMEADNGRFKLTFAGGNWPSGTSA